jgi:hypothetical protein
MCRKLTLAVIIISLLAPAGGATAADLIIPVGSTMTKNTTESFGYFMVAGRLTVENGANLTFTGDSHIDGVETSGIRPEIIMNGGSFSVGARINMGTDKVGNGGNYAYLTMNGGTFTCTGTFKFPDDEGGVHRIYLNDGIMHSDDIQMYHSRDAIIYVGAGILRLNTVIPGNPEYDPAEWVNQGALLPAEGYDEIVIEDKGTYTEVTALPSGPRIQFETAASEGLESISPAVLTVTLSNAEAGETYTVDYAATDGTAIGGGVDYSLTPDTLTFNPGQTSLPLEFTVVNDGLDEDDETVIVELSNPTGPDVLLGNTSQHTYTILDPRPGVGFAQPASAGLESVSPAAVAVTLSAGLGETVMADYAVTDGTATGGGTDYMLLGSGTLSFAPWDTSETISMSIVDDSIEEIPSETVELTLSNPSSNVKLSLQNQHTYTIIDNEAGVVWDGLTWYYSEDPPTALFINADGQLEWSPEKGAQYVTRIPDSPLSQVGDIVEFTYWWMTDGDHDCPDCFDCDLYCLDDDITCIAGTSDMRVGLFEADGEYITDDGFDTSSSIFAGYKGYAWRFGPNMKAGPTRWVDCTDEVHKTGQFQKKAESSSNLMTTNDGLMEALPGFELPPGEWSLFTISLERLSSSSVETSITLNDTTYTWTDGSSSGQPQNIDVLAVHMRNGRPYSRLVLDTVWQPPPQLQAWNPSPLDGAEGQCADVVLSWYAGDCIGKKGHAVYFGDSYEAVDEAVPTDPEFKGLLPPISPQTYDPPGDLELWRTYFWRIDELSAGGPCGAVPDTKGDVWSFSTGFELLCAGNPSPADGTGDVDPNVVLSWSPGQNAASHDVYVGADFDSVNDANTSSSEYKGSQSIDANSYDPPEPLESGGIYYWRIDEVNDVNICKGEVWTITLRGYIIVDDMEAYTGTWQGEGDHPLDEGWTDYFANDTGSTLYLRTGSPVRDEQSMEYWYDNSWLGSLGYCSESKSLGLNPTDWAGSGAKILSLWFYGDLDNDANDTEQMYVGLEDDAGLYAELRYGDNEDEDMSDIKIADWQEWNMPLPYFSDSNFAAEANDVNLADVNALFIGFGVRGGLVAGGVGTVFFDDIRLYPPRCVPELGPYADLSGDCIVDFADVEALAEDWLYIGLSAADLYEDNTVNLKDFAVLADSWLDEQLWPSEE